MTKTLAVRRVRAQVSTDGSSGRGETHDIESLERLANLLDTAFRIPGVGWRFGLDAVLDLIPGIGDALGALASLFIFQAARRYGLSRVTLARMALNIAIDFIGGLLPFLGPVFDAYWKANIMNVTLLKRHLAATPVEARRARRGDTAFVVLMIVALVAFMVAVGALVFWALAALVKLLHL
jgi:Domain of unknown function (DUF4112)